MLKKLFAVFTLIFLTACSGDDSDSLAGKLHNTQWELTGQKDLLGFQPATGCELQHGQILFEDGVYHRTAGLILNGHCTSSQMHSGYYIKGNKLFFNFTPEETDFEEVIALYSLTLNGDTLGVTLIGYHDKDGNETITVGENERKEFVYTKVN